MVAFRLSLLGAAGLLSGLTIAQFPPTPEGVTVLESQLDDGVTISYKEVGHLHTVLDPVANEPRPTSVKPQKACEASPAMFISQLEH